MVEELKLIEVSSKEEYEALKGLVLEYAEELGVDLCFQKFDEELASLSKHYGAPFGASALLVNSEGEYIACVGIRKLGENEAELKRMYIKKKYRGKGYGVVLLKFSIEQAKKMNYRSLRLDTLRSLKPAIKLYKGFGFVETEAYRHNPYEGVVYMELNLEKGEL